MVPSYCELCRLVNSIMMIPAAELLNKIAVSNIRAWAVYYLSEIENGKGRKRVYLTRFTAGAEST